MRHHRRVIVATLTSAVIAAVTVTPAVPHTLVAQTQPAGDQPAGRTGAYLVFDGERRVMLLFGGSRRDDLGQISYPEDLWAWDGIRWRELEAADGIRPPGRDVPHAAFDAHRARLVISGGRRESRTGLPEILDDTWEWNGTRWREIKAHGAPRVLHAAAGYDPVRQRVALFGGGEQTASGFAFSRRMWEWDGSVWSVRDSLGPAGALPALLAFAVDGSATVLITSQQGDAGGARASTAHWTGARWGELQSAPAFANLQAAAVASNGTIMLYQSWDRWLTNPVTHLREPSGGWRAVSASTNPGMRTTVAASYDPVRRRFVVFGGRNETGYLNDVWEFDGEAWRRAR